MKNFKEIGYIIIRQIEAFFIFLLYQLFKIFKININKIVFTTFEGVGGFCCNPRYIATELLERNLNYELVWLVDDLQKEFPDKIIKVKNNFINRAYQLSTAKIWIDNSRKPYGTYKRKNQVYIQTWHAGIGLKPIGEFRGALLPKMAYIVSKYDSNLIDYIISNSDWCTQLYPEMLLYPYNGKIVKTGSPRCDIFVTKRDEIYKHIRERYHIQEDAKIVMYAPTFRGGSQKGSRQVFLEEPTLDFNRLVTALEEKFDGKWFVFLRLHPQLAAQIDKLPLRNSVRNKIDVSQADDMNELLAASDVLITDYSSSAFDAINMYMPVFLYLDDLNEYVEERGKLMWDIHSLPFTCSTTNEELIENIDSFEPDNYKKDIICFLNKYHVLEDGRASARIADLVESGNI